MFPVENAKEVLVSYREWTLSLQKEVSTVFKTIKFPDIDQIPTPLRGRHVIIIVGCGLQENAKSFKKLEELNPILSETKIIPYQEMASFMNEPIEPFKFYAETKSFDHISEDLMKTFADSLINDSNTKSMIIEFRHLGGILNDYDNNNSLIEAKAQGALNIIIGLSADETHKDGKQKTTELNKELRPLQSEHILPNFLYYGDDHNSVKKSYRADALEKLMKVRRKYDPSNLILSNLKI